jgi:AcrR family transcriptional regulator
MGRSPGLASEGIDAAKPEAEEIVPAKGRPRDPKTTRLIQKVALDLAYVGGIGNATVERIAEHSGIAKSTIYRRWPNAAAIVMDGFLDEIGPLIAYDGKGSIVGALTSNLRHLVAALAGQRGELLRHLVGAAQTDVELRDAFLRQLIVPRRELARAAFQEAIARRELRAEADPETILDLLYGAVYYRLFVSFSPFDPGFVDAIVERAFHGLTTRP